MMLVVFCALPRQWTGNTIRLASDASHRWRGSLLAIHWLADQWILYFGRCWVWLVTVATNGWPLAYLNKSPVPAGSTN